MVARGQKGSGRRCGCRIPALQTSAMPRFAITGPLGGDRLQLADSSATAVLERDRDPSAVSGGRMIPHQATLQLTREESRELARERRQRPAVAPPVPSQAVSAAIAWCRSRTGRRTAAKRARTGRGRSRRPSTARSGGRVGLVNQRVRHFLSWVPAFHLTRHAAGATATRRRRPIDLSDERRTVSGETAPDPRQRDHEVVGELRKGRVADED
jgi:hypothetical protein